MNKTWDLKLPISDSHNTFGKLLTAYGEAQETVGTKKALMQPRAEDEQDASELEAEISRRFEELTKKLSAMTKKRDALRRQIVDMGDHDDSPH